MAPYNLSCYDKSSKVIIKSIQWLYFDIDLPNTIHKKTIQDTNCFPLLAFCLWTWVFVLHVIALDCWILTNYYLTIHQVVYPLFQLLTLPHFELQRIWFRAKDSPIFELQSYQCWTFEISYFVQFGISFHGVSVLILCAILTHCYATK